MMKIHTVDYMHNEYAPALTYSFLRGKNNRLFVFMTNSLNFKEKYASYLGYNFTHTL